MYKGREKEHNFNALEENLESQLRLISLQCDENFIHAQRLFDEVGENKKRE